MCVGVLSSRDDPRQIQEQFLRGTVSLQSHVGPRSSSTLTSVSVPHPYRLVPGFLRSWTPTPRAAGGTCAMCWGWCRVKTKAQLSQ